jgi:hypothetical protein
MKRWVVVLLVACRHTLEPGETRCTTRDVLGTAVTKCRTGEDTPNWWCFAVDGDGPCFGTPGRCEAARSKYVSTGYGACTQQPVAICTDDAGCWTSARACAQAERRQGRDGSDCETQANHNDD